MNLVQMSRSLRLFLSMAINLPPGHGMGDFTFFWPETVGPGKKLQSSGTHLVEALREQWARAARIILGSL